MIGDGKSDIALINDSGVNIYTFDVSGSTWTGRKVSTYTGLKKGGSKRSLVVAGGDQRRWAYGFAGISEKKGSSLYVGRL